MTELALRPRSATEIIDLAVRLLRRHFGAFFTIGLVGAIPILVLQLIFLAIGRTDMITGFQQFVGLGLVSFVVALVFRSLMIAALLLCADDALRTGQADVGRAIQQGAGRLGIVLAVSVLTSLAIGVGMLLFIVPGVYLALRLATAVPAAAVEGDGVVEAIQRAWARADGHLIHTLKVVLLLFLLYLAFFFGIGLLTGIGGAVTGGVGAGRVGGGTFFVVVQVVTALLTAALYPLLTNALLLLTYDLRVRREGYDVEVMADALGAAR